MVNPDIFSPFEKLVEVEILGEKFSVPEQNDLLRCFQYLALELRGRGGGERFKPHPTRPSKTLKRLFQEAGVPEFERARLPLVWRGEQLIYVAGLGPDARLVDTGGARVRLEWQPDAPLLGG